MGKITNFEKLSLIFILFLVIIVICSGAFLFYNFLSNSFNYNENDKEITKFSFSLDNIKHHYVLEEFNKIQVIGAFDIYIDNNPNHKEELLFHDDILEKEVANTEFFVKDKTLIIKNKYNKINTNKFPILIKAKEIKKIILDGSGDVLLANEVSKDEFTVSLNGSGQININEIKSKKVSIDLNGSGEVNMNGHTNKVKINLAGSGEVNLEKLKATNGEINLTGSGNINLENLDTLYVKKTGSGNINYRYIKNYYSNKHDNNFDEEEYNKIIDKKGDLNKVKKYCPSNPTPGACIQVYEPVCGYFKPIIQCIKAPCAKTFSNSCLACQDNNVSYWQDGDCPI